MKSFFLVECTIMRGIRYTVAIFLRAIEYVKMFSFFFHVNVIRFVSEKSR